MKNTGLLRRSVRAHLLPLAIAKLQELGAVITKASNQVVRSTLEGKVIVTFPKTMFPTVEALQAFILQMLGATDSPIQPSAVIWLQTEVDHMVSGCYALTFTTAFLANEADNGKQAHSGHRALAQRWIVDSTGKDIQVLANGGQPVPAEVQATAVAVAARLQESAAQQVAVVVPMAPEVQEASDALLVSQPLTGQARGRNRRTARA